MSWLEQHIEEFVKPTFRDSFFELKSLDIDSELKRPLDYFGPEELTIIKNSWRAIKKNAKGKQILLPGRDVYIFEILARRENYPTIFMPECSRLTVKYIAKQFTPRQLKGMYLFDTGFAGSIPRNLGTKQFGLLSYASYDSVGTQIFPRLTMSRGLALKIERTPKYWDTGRMVGGSYAMIGGSYAINTSEEEVHQGLSNAFEFLKAARLTIEVYKNNAPKFIKQHKPLPLIVGY